MSAVERLEEQAGGMAQHGLPKDASPIEAASTLEEALTVLPDKRGARLRPLLALAPYVARYRGRASLALIALTVAAVTTLVVPVAVRRMIDFGFTPEGIAKINSYFSVMIAVVGLLALASASRYYLVMTIGERIVADLRRDVFAHLMSLSPAFFDSSRSGELISRLTADTTQIKSAVGASVSIALRNLMLFIGATAMMVVTSARLSGLVLLAIPVIVLPLVAFGRWVRRLSRTAQDTLADASAYASELVGAIRTVQAYTGEQLANERFGGEVEQAYEAARGSTRARAVLTAIIIFIVFTSVVLILWIGSNDVLIGTISPGRLGQFVLYTAFAAAALGQLSEVWGEVSAASGAAERLFEILRVRSAISAPASPRALPEPARGDVALDHVSFAYPARPQMLAVDDVSFSVGRARRSQSSGHRGRARARCFICCCASTIPPPVRFRSTACRSRRPTRARCESTSHWCRKSRWCSPQAPARTSVSAGPTPPMPRSSAPPIWRMPASSSESCPAASMPRSASVASRCRGASASASRLRGRSCVVPRCCCWTRRPPRSTRNRKRWYRRRWRN